MKVLIIGGAGMVGRKLAERLARDGKLGADVVFHLAAIVSGEAEMDFDKGYRINLDGTRHLFDAIRAAGHGPRVVFTSSIAVFGAPFPESIPDEFHTTPLTSYGTQKAIGELLLADYTRKGIFDGVGIRLPTICVRPGKPNKAASGFFSNIIREPLVGAEAILPVPGVSVTVGEQIEALRNVAGDKVVARIKREPDQMIIDMVGSWARRFDATRATELGFKAESSFEEIIQAHIDDELGGKIA